VQPPQCLSFPPGDEAGEGGPSPISPGIALLAGSFVIEAVDRCLLRQGHPSLPDHRQEA